MGFGDRKSVLSVPTLNARRHFNPGPRNNERLATDYLFRPATTAYVSRVSTNRPYRKPNDSARVPIRWRRELASVLITQEQLAARIRLLTLEIKRDYIGLDLVIVSLLNGTVIFLADLIRQLSLPLRLDFIGVSSYGGGTESRELVFTKELRIDVRKREVLLVDDILDTGRTLNAVLKKLRALKPRRIRTCVLLDKPDRRVEKIRAHYVGFTIPNEFVVGYGLDYAERYRNLPFIAVLRPEVYGTA